MKLPKLPMQTSYYTKYHSILDQAMKIKTKKNKETELFEKYILLLTPMHSPFGHRSLYTSAVNSCRDRARDRARNRNGRTL